MFKLRSFSGTYSRIPASRIPAIYLAARFRIRTQITPDYSAINHHSAAIKGPIKSRFCKSDCPTIARISYTPSLDTYRARTVSQSVLSRDVRELKCTLWPVSGDNNRQRDIPRARILVLAFFRLGYARYARQLSRRS